MVDIVNRQETLSHVALASDHAGVRLKKTLIGFVEALGYVTVDLGTHGSDSVDYPDYAKALCHTIKEKRAHKGILVCGSGIGMSIVANRYAYIRCALVFNVAQAKLCRQHNDCNVIALGERITPPQTAKDCVEVFLQTDFLGGRHQRRVDMYSTES